MQIGTVKCTANLIAVVAAAIAVMAAIETMRIRPHLDHPTIAFVDVAAIMQQSDAGKSVQAQVAPRQQALRQDAEAKLKEFKHEQDEMNMQRHSLSTEEFAEKDAALKKKIADWNAEAQKREAALNNAVNPAVQKIHEVLHQQLAMIASEARFTAILPVQEAFYADKGMDVTAEAMRSVNEQLPKLDVSFAEEKPAK